MSVVTARYAGTCTACGCATDVGDRVNWTRGAGVRHANAAVCEEARSLADSYSISRAEQAFELGANYGRVNGWYDNPNDSWTSDDDYDRNGRW